MGTMKQRQREVQLYRGQIPSPGRPTIAWRQDRVAFWAEIAKGEKTDDAAKAAGVSSPVGYRWVRHAGGVNPRLSPTVSGRYLWQDGYMAGTGETVITPVGELDLTSGSNKVAVAGMPPSQPQAISPIVDAASAPMACSTPQFLLTVI